MLRKIQEVNARVEAWQERLYASFGNDISTRRGRALAALHTHVADHAFLRRIWTNTAPLGAHAWRSNQPDRWRFPRLAEMGIRTVINLRGALGQGAWLFEREACAAHGMRLVDLELNAYVLDPPETYLRLLSIFDTAERPLLMHCKSGADRSGLAAAFYLNHVEGVPMAEAGRQLSLRFAHRRWSRAGVLDALIETIAADMAQTPMSLREWLETRYRPEEIQARFEAGRRGASR